MECQELFLSDVVRVDLIPTASCTIPIPFNVPAITSVQNPTLGTPALSVGFEGQNLTSEVEQSPTLKDTEQPQVLGYLHTIELNAPVAHGFADLRTARKALLGVDFHMVAHTQDGTRYLCYALPNTSKVSLEEQMGSNATITVKATLNSLSGFIRIETTSNG